MTDRVCFNCHQWMSERCCEFCDYDPPRPRAPRTGLVSRFLRWLA